jgi:GT2 family glycosyltransferase
MMKNPLVSIVIVNWNGLEDTKLCLEHTKKQTYKNTEIIVVDNGSQDGSADYFEKLKDIKLVKNPNNLGFTGGHIAGYKASKGEYVLLLNNDAIMDPSYVDKAVAAMESDGQIGAIGGRAYAWDENNPLFDRTNDFYAYQVVNPITAEGIFSKHDLGVPQSVNVVSGSCVMVSKKAIEQVGYLHDPFFAYYEESDLFARMKRAGYKIIYNPGLAIWHANAKSTNKKPPTFFYYMLMRNRFRFAVRNFDNWSLIRFLKFYLIMGAVSIIKSVLPLKQGPMHRAYAKAFFYNLIFGFRAFRERRQLARNLGRSNYNQLIVREQNGISLVIGCENKKNINFYLDLAGHIGAIDELILVLKDDLLAEEIGSSKKLPRNLRAVVDRGFFNTHLINLGAICSKNEWLILSRDLNSSAIKEAYDIYSEKLYITKRSGKYMALIADHGNSFSSFNDSLNRECSQELFVNRDMFIDESGLDKSLSIEDAKRQLIAYSYLSKNYRVIFKDGIINPLPRYTGAHTETELKKDLNARLRRASIDRKLPTALDKISNRYYRLAQLRNLLSWLTYPRIPWRLKLGRTKNIVIALFTLNKSRLANELKHMRNEVMIYKNSLDIVGLKDKEQTRLAYLKKNPRETVIFIILRDRYDALKEQIGWLDSQGFKKVVLIDNDSLLPPLVDFLNTTKCQVLELARNMKQTAPWSAGIVKVLVQDDFYVVTDPDIIPTRSQKDVLPHLYELHSKYPNHVKIGLGLKIDDLPDHYPLKGEVIKWESQFWEHPVEEGVYEAGVDTTFALYKPYTYKYLLHPALRTGEPYIARHLPWYKDSNKLTDEDVFYQMRADHNVSSWNKSHLPERYKKELEKQG